MVFQESKPAPHARVLVKIRPAKASDKSPILEFCRNTWPGGDYIPEVWDDWMRSKNGRILVAVDRDKPVGMAHAWFQTKKIAWLEGVRINPSYRGRGLAGRLNKALTQYAARKGATTARLCTGSSNTASRRHLAKTGFELLQRFQRLESQLPLKRYPHDVSRLVPGAPAWKWIANRPEFNLFHQMYSDGWTWHPLNAHSFASLLHQGGVISTGRDSPSTCSLFYREEGRITLGFTAGRSREITAHGRYLRALAAQRNEKVRALVPKSSKFVPALEKAGFEKSGTILVYEKHLT